LTAGIIAGMEPYVDLADVHESLGIKEASTMAETLTLSIAGVGVVAVIGVGEQPTTFGFPAFTTPGSERAHERIVKRIQNAVAKGTELPVSCAVEGITWCMLTEPIRSSGGAVIAVLVVARQGRAWSSADRRLVKFYGDVLGLIAAQSRRETNLISQGRLDELVSDVAERLMSATAESRDEVLTWTVRTLAEFLGADVAFIRRHDHKNGLSILEAEWPPREMPSGEEDPLGVVRFDSDPIFARSQNVKGPFFLSDEEETESYWEHIDEEVGIPEVGGLALPLLVEDNTWGILGFLHFSQHAWVAPELHALQAVASMLVQLQGRFDAEDKISYNANHDDLTGLPNRRALVAELERRLAQKRPMAAMVIDLDRFKVMNDFLGHANGDRLLRTMSDRLRTSIRTNDFAARLGGDEFVFLADGVSSDLEATASAERILNILAAPVEIAGQMVSHTASIGVVISGDEQSGLELLGRADVAMYDAKSRGRAQTIVFDDRLREAVNEKSRTELLLAEAIESGGLRLHFQPEVDLITGELMAVESLVRWEHPKRGLLNAAEFISIAEETGLVVGIGRWVFEEACRQLSIWAREYPELTMAVRVNMSPADFKFSDLVGFVEGCLDRYSIDPSRMCIEITEHAVQDETEHTANVLRRFRELGMEIALDDFGTGSASMTQLKNLPVDFLKLDMSFVRGVAEGRFDRAIVESICLLAKALDLDVIGEGVEDATIAATLVELGCHRAQGYLMSRPMSAADLTPVLVRGGVDPSVYEIALAALV
jgi:diguanylate cyclase (GGDEF)-like protein